MNTNRNIFRLAVLLLLLVINHIAMAGAETRIIWHGHATFEVITPKGAVLMIDPWLNNPVNPAAKNNADPVAAITRLDYILITHGHFDHVGDAVALAKKTGARLVTNFELGTNMAKVLGFPQQQMGFDTLMNIGGEISIADGEVKVTMTPAVHSSGLNNPFADEKAADIIYGGNPAGYVLEIENGPTIYHSGDTAYFKDMELIGELYRPDLALLNIGGHFGMEPEMAVRAAKSINARLVVPHHFATFPVLTQDPGAFFDKLTKAKIAYRRLAAGAQLSYSGKRLNK